MPVIMPREINLAKGEETSFCSNEDPSRSLALIFLRVVVFQSTTVLKGWLILTVLLDLTVLDKPLIGFNPWISLLILTLFPSVVRSAVRIIQHYRLVWRLNTQLFEVWKKGQFQSIRSESIRVGNYILLREGQQAPADLLIIATGSSTHSCCIDCAAVTGESSLLKRQAIRETAKIVRSLSLPHAISQVGSLSGWITLGEPCEDYDKIDAAIKMPGSPKARKLSMDQCIIGNAVIKVAPWVIGVVIYTGKETKVGLGLAHRRVASKEIAASKWLGGEIGLIVILAVILTLAGGTTALDMRLVAFILLLSWAVPMPLVLALELIRTVRAIVLASSFKPLASISILNPDITDSLSQTTDIFVDPGALLAPHPFLTHILINELEFTREANDLNLDDFPISNRSKTRDRTETELLTFQPSERGDKTSGFTQLKSVGCASAAVLELCECLCLCTTLVSSPEGDLQPTDLDEVAILEAMKSVGCEYEAKSAGGCQLRLFGEKRYYEVIWSGERTAATLRSRCLFQLSGKEASRLYIKGAFPVMGNILDLNSQEYQALFVKVQTLETRGIEPVICGYVDLTAEQTSSIRNDLITMQFTMIDANPQINKLFERVEEEGSVKLLGVVGLTLANTVESETTIKAISNAGVRIWLTSSQSETQTLSLALSTNLIPENETVVRLGGLRKTDMLLWEMLRALRFCVVRTSGEISRFQRLLTECNLPFKDLQAQHLHHIRSPYLRQVSQFTDVIYPEDPIQYSLLIDSQSLDLAFQTLQGRKILGLLCSGARVICCSALSATLKRQLVLFARESDSSLTLAVISNASGIGMMQEAHLGIALEGRSRLIESHSDAVISRIGALASLELGNGAGRTASTTELLVFCHVLLGTVLGGYACLSDYSGTLLISPGLIVAYSFLFAGGYIMLVGTLQREQISALQIGYWALFPSLKGFLQGVFLIVCLYLASGPIQPNGFTADFSSMGVMGIILIVESSSWAISLEAGKWQWGLLGSCLALGSLFIYLGIETLDSSSDLFSSLEILFSQSTSVVSFFLTPLLTPILTLVLSFLPSPLASTSLPSAPTSLAVPVPSSTYHINPLSLQFDLYHHETAYRDIYIKRHLQLIRVMLLSLSLLMILWIGVGFILSSPSSSFTGYQIGVAVLFAFMTWLTFTSYFRRRYVPIIASIIALGLGVKITAELLYSMLGGMGTAMAALTTYIFLNVEFRIISALNVSSFALFIASGVSAVQSLDHLERAMIVLCYTVLLAGIIFLAAQAGYHIEYADRLAYQIRSNTLKEVEKSRSILSLLLPSFVIPRVVNRAEGTYIAEDQGEVTVIFCDLCDFESICALYTPQELLSLLDQVFQRFDDLCLMRGVAKIETVGKTYLACAGLKYVEEGLSAEIRGVLPVRRALNFAFDVLLASKSFRLKTGKSLQLKVGINSGPVISGVVGYHKPQFSLVGDTVNTASRMCSTLLSPDAIQISAATKSLLFDTDNIFFFPRVVYAKGKGRMDTFLVTRLEEVEMRSRSASMQETTANPRRQSILAERPSFIFASSLIATKPPGLGRLCPFLESTEERKFRIALAKDMSSANFWTLIGMFFTQTLLFFLRLLQYLFLPSYACWQILLAYAILPVILLIKPLLHRRFSLSCWYPLFRLPFYMLISFLILTDLIYSTKYPSELIIIDIMAFYILATWSGPSFFKPSLLLAGLLAIFWIGASPLAENVANHMVEWVFLLIYAGINLYAIYEREKQTRLNLILKQIEDQEIAKNENLLTYMLPKAAYSKLKSEQLVNDHFHNVTILFADIVGFTNYSASKTPTEVISMLSTLFTAFDLLCLEYHIYKVHTIGDCYVVLGMDGRSEGELDMNKGGLRVVCFAREMIRVIKEVNERNGSELNMRIGIHTGEVIAGITGKDVIRYDIYDPAVMVANQMESEGQAGKVNLSEVTRELIEHLAPNLLTYENNKWIKAKSIGTQYMSYFCSVQDYPRLKQLALDP